MNEATLPIPLQRAVTVTTAGATGVARLVVEGLEEIAHDRATLNEAVEYLLERLPGYAPMWHIAVAARGERPLDALRRFRRELDEAVYKSVTAAAEWVTATAGGGPVTVAPSSSLVAEVLARLGCGREGSGPPVALAGADAVGPDAVLNIRGTRELAGRLPTLVVTTSAKLVPEAVFARLGAPAFERVPLALFSAVVLDGEIVSPGTAGRRAAAVAVPASQ